MSGNSEDLCEITGGVLAGGGHAAKLLLLLLGELGLLAPQLALGPGNGHSFTCAHPDQVGLELGKGGQDFEEYLAHRILGVMNGSAQGELGSLFRQMIGDVPGIENRRGQAVQPGHHQSVALCARRSWPDPGRARLVPVSPLSMWMRSGATPSPASSCLCAVSQ